MKNHRSVCFAINAGYAEYKGLPGILRTGCPNTPAFKSRYCSLHSPFEESTNSATSTETTKPTSIIIGKRITRQGINYEVNAYELLSWLIYMANLQVVWFNTATTKSSWESASSLPSSLIEEYENSIKGEIAESFASGGQTVHTILTSKSQVKSKESSCSQDSVDAPPVKKIKKDSEIMLEDQ